MESEAAEMSLSLVAAALKNFGPSPLRIALCGTAFVAAIISVSFAAYAAYMALSISIAGYWAAAIVAGGALLLAIVLVAIARMNRRPSRPSRARAPNRDMPPEAFAELMQTIRTSPKQAATVALVTGFVAGFCPDLLKTARDLIDPE